MTATKLRDEGARQLIKANLLTSFAILIIVLAVLVLLVVHPGT